MPLRASHAQTHASTFASYWKNLNESHRTLTKSFGLRFIISVSGTGGKFDIITLTLNIGSIIGIFGLASVLSDIVVLHLCRNAHVYKQHIVERVDRNTIRKDIQYSLQAKTEQNIRIDLYSKEHTASLTNESRIGRTRSPSIIRPLVVINTVKTHSSKDDQLPVRTQV
ncbi:unnamed protein product [Didymodactylos carnosus]|uniref:Uncharacterized protein n=1 Tax=Didymodactylos carnosus TaxID=1234261 RepID=A0A815I7M8_9BILA|nr:unnamed protein product [Didymodactylos carnosus]CAF1362461.1 unnamed protein product [Didymodactylos carnosus]CAF4018564.1 unnamed protein product [Didymodactylos carnosus]CAF4242276.1 unnamed protein product [Didymodactylos carnosus]